MDLNLIFANNLRVYRHKANMTQKELGKLANISQKRMCELESGGDRIPFSTIEKLAAALKIAPYLLFVRPEDMSR